MGGDGGCAAAVRAAALAWGLRLHEAQVVRLGAHLDAVSRRAEEMNLTAIRGCARMAVLHVLDALAPVRLGIGGGGRAVDIGSGAGFPGLPLVWCGWCTSVTLVEATRRKCAFLTEATRDDARVRVVWARAEEWRDDGGGFDVAVVRAVGPLAMIVEVAFGLVRPEGRVWAWKGPEGVGAELEAAKRAAGALGGQYEATLPYSLPDGAGERVLVGFRRGAGPLPAGYPRRHAAMRRRPAGS